MTSCIFCRIAAGDLPSATVFEDDEVLAFRDVNPAAPTHILVIPKKHVERLVGLESETTPLLGKIVRTAAQVAGSEGLAESGYRLLINQGKNAGQLVSHLHLHVLGGRRLKELG